MTIDNQRERKTNPAHLMLREVWSTGDLALIDELVTEDHVHHEPLLTAPLEGREALKRWVETVGTGAPDLSKTVDATYVDDGTAVLTYTASGTHDGEIVGIESTGRTFEVDGVYITHIVNGKLGETFDTWDAFGLISQRGTFPEVV